MIIPFRMSLFPSSWEIVFVFSVIRGSRNVITYFFNIDNGGAVFKMVTFTVNLSLSFYFILNCTHSLKPSELK